MTTEDEAGRLADEIGTLRTLLAEKEAEWAFWCDGNKYLTSQSRKERLQELRDQIYKMQARLDRLKR